MYLNYYQLKTEPFNVTPDPEFLFLSPGHKEALASIVYAVEKRKGFMSIVGEVGVGKTTILRSYLKSIDQQKVKTIYIFNANVSFRAVLNTIFEELGIIPMADEVFEMVNQLQLALIEEYKKGHNVVLVIDEAQNMPFETLENLRMLSNLETTTDKLIQILLIGQPEFEKILDTNKLRQLKQRIAVRTTLTPLSMKESVDYIKHRLSKADVADVKTVFTKDSLNKIVKKAKGVPRLLNILCDNALITGYGYQMRPVRAGVVREVIRDFEGERKIPVLKWGMITAVILLAVAVPFYLYAYKEMILSNYGNYTFFGANGDKTETDPSLEQKRLLSTDDPVLVDEAKKELSKMEQEKKELEELKSKFQERVDAEMVKLEEIIKAQTQ